MNLPMFTILGYNQDNFLQDFPEHILKGGGHVLKIDQLLSELNRLSYESAGYNQEKVDIAKKIMLQRQKAIDKGFPVLKWDCLDDRISEAKEYLISSEKRALHKELKRKEEYKDETADDQIMLEASYF